MNRFAVLGCSLVAFFSSCSINKLAINKVSDALTGSGSNTVFLGDTDPQLVGDALPFAIKMYETLLDKNPNHPGLILTTGSLFVMYANAYVQGPADMLPPGSYAEKLAALERAKKLYLRGAAILERGIVNKYPGLLAPFTTEGETGNFDITAELAAVKKEDVPLFYWYAAGNLSAYALDPFDIGLGMRIFLLSAMMERAYELDPDFNSGALDDFFLLLYASLPEGMGGSGEKAEIHYRRALEKSGGRSAGPYVSYAQAVAVPAQDYQSFRENLEAALAVDPESDPSNTLVNIINQRKAKYLLEKAGELFAEFGGPDDAWDDDNYE
ncbi:MAG: TRAP transporter TatT component family protein [Treponema sp.]|nr:TRAP transporter TatT component family protein [Treponema sp.]